MNRSPSTIAAGRSAAGNAVRVVRALEQERWSAFVNHHPDGRIFHTPEMHRVFAETRGHRPEVWATLDEAGEIRALITPVAIDTLRRLLRALTTRVVAFAGPLVEGGAGEREALHALLDTYRHRTRRRVLYTEIRHLVDAEDLAPVLAACGFDHERHLNFLVDLTAPEDALWQRVAPSARRNVRRAQREGVAVGEVADPTRVAGGYEVLREVYRRIRVPLPDRTLFEAAVRVLGPLGRMKFLTASLGHRTIGVLTLLLYKGVATYWYTGTLRAFASCRAGDLLTWHAIVSARRAGCRELDFGGAGRPDEPYGVRDFKAKYGGRLVDFGRERWVPSPARLRAATVGYELMRRFL